MGNPKGDITQFADNYHLNKQKHTINREYGVDGESSSNDSTPLKIKAGSKLDRFKRNSIKDTDEDCGKEKDEKPVIEYS